MVLRVVQMTPAELAVQPPQERAMYIQLVSFALLLVATLGLMRSFTATAIGNPFVTRQRGPRLFIHLVSSSKSLHFSALRGTKSRRVNV